MRQQKSLLRRFKENALGHTYGQGVTLVVQFLSVPFFLNYWGTERYAEWLVLTGIPAMLSLLDFGVAQALASTATMQASAGNRKDATGSLQTALVFTLFACLFVMLLASTVGMWLDWSNLLGLKTINKDQAAIVVLIMAGYLCVGTMGGPLSAWLRTIDREPQSAALLSSRRLIDVLISIGVLAAGGDAIALATGMLVGQMVAMVLLYALAISWSPWVVLGLSEASWTTLRDTMKPSLAYAVLPMAQTVTLQGGLQILNQVATPSAVVAFTMARTLMRLIMQVGVVAHNAMKPDLARWVGLGRTTEAEGFVSQVSKKAFLGGLMLYFILASAGPFIIQVWGQNKVHVDRLDLFLIGLHALINIAWYAPAAMLIAINTHTRIYLWYGLSSCFALIAWASCSSFISPLFGVSLMLLTPELVMLGMLKKLRHLKRENFDKDGAG